MQANQQALRREYIPPELISYGKLETITSSNCNGTLIKVGSSPDDVIINNQQQVGNPSCLPN